MKLDNETKIRVCNLFNRLSEHIGECVECNDYVSNGDGDLCERGKELIFEGLYAVDTTKIV